MKGIKRKELSGQDTFTRIPLGDLESGSYRVVVTHADNSHSFQLVKR